MTFFVVEPVGKRADVAKSTLDGDHHKKGEHTLLDRSHEFAAERVEHVGTDGGTDGEEVSARKPLTAYEQGYCDPGEGWT